MVKPDEESEGREEIGIGSRLYRIYYSAIGILCSSMVNTYI